MPIVAAFIQHMSFWEGGHYCPQSLQNAFLNSQKQLLGSHIHVCSTWDHGTTLTFPTVATTVDREIFVVNRYSSVPYDDEN